MSMRIGEKNLGVSLQCPMAPFELIDDRIVAIEIIFCFVLFLFELFERSTFGRCCLNRIVDRERKIEKEHNLWCLVFVVRGC